MEKLNYEQGRLNRGEVGKERWSQVRKSDWFNQGPVAILSTAVGSGNCCMFCDAGEGNEVEHYRPRAMFPELTFDWVNFLWACGVCNRNKGAGFFSKANAALLNPFDDQVWDYIYLNNYGQYSGKIGLESGAMDERGEWTVELIKLNRDGLRDRRQRRIEELRSWAEMAVRQMETDASSMDAIKAARQERLDSPLQPDVAQYFLNGPGRFRGPGDPVGWPFPRLHELLQAGN